MSNGLGRATVLLLLVTLLLGPISLLVVVE
jgi:hypothetical protein